MKNAAHLAHAIAAMAKAKVHTLRSAQRRDIDIVAHVAELADLVESLAVIVESIASQLTSDKSTG